MIQVASGALRESESARTTQDASLRRKLFSFPVALCSMLVLLAFLSVLNRFNDTDTWWHLKMGQVMWTTHVIPTTDIFSYTTNHHAWVPHEWLAQLSMYAFYVAGGYRGIMLWLFLSAAAIFVLGYLLCAIYSGNLKTAFVGALTVWIFSTVGLSPRPQLLGYLLMLVELIFIELARTRSARWLYGLPPLFAIWVNVHGSFSFGMIILAVTVACSYVSGQWGLIVSRPWNKDARNWLTFCAVLSVLALAINPDGPRQILYPIDLLINQPVSLKFVQEWLPLTIASGRGLAFFATLAFIGVVVAVKQSAIRLEEAVLLCGAGVSALQHSRLVIVFGLIAAPIVARFIAPLWDQYDAHSDRPWLNAIMMAGVVAVVWVAFPSQSKLDKIVREKNPTEAVRYIRENHLTGPMLNAYDFGGYLIWALPEQPVFIDGRADVYEWTGIMDEMARWVMSDDDPNLLLNRHHIHFCVFEKGSPAARIMSGLANWKQVYSDRLSVIFVRS